LDSQQGRRPIGVVSAVERVKISGDKQIQNPSQCKRCLQFGCTGKTCCETHAELGDELPSTILTENRKRKGAVSPSSSNSVAPQAPDNPKRRYQGVNLLPQALQGRQRKRRLHPLQELQTHVVAWGLQPGEGQQHSLCHRAHEEALIYVVISVFFCSLMYGVNVAILCCAKLVP